MTDLRAAVLAGIDAELRVPDGYRHSLALRLLREDTERHRHHYEGNGDETGNYWACAGCARRVKRGTWCAVILSRARVYAPEALAEVEAKK